MILTFAYPMIEKYANKQSIINGDDWDDEYLEHERRFETKTC